jgi:hypothetical protein
MLRTIVLISLLISSVGHAQKIAGSKHDFSVGSGRIEIAGEFEICIFCHTPHHAELEPAPLWDHETTVAAFDTYTSITLNADDVDQPSGISKLCLSCHDGSVAIDSYGGNVGHLKINSVITKIGTDLSNNHPISFIYDEPLATADGSLEDPETNLAVSDLLFENKVECPSCHDVHNNAPVPFNFDLLRLSNDGSALCLSCHIK